MNQFKGVYTALVTPFQNQKVDEGALRSLVDWQIEQGIDGLVACGTTGESATLSLEEKKSVIRIIIDEAKNRVPVIAGTGTNNTANSIELTKWAKDHGASGALVVTPYYNKPSQQGLYRHFEALSNIGLPLILYNVPGRTSVSLTPQTIGQLSEIENIVAIKEATGSLSFASEVIQETGERIGLISGDDFTFLPLLSLGAEGVISVVSNITPALFKELYTTFQKGDLSSARSIHFRLYPLIQALFIETNPVPVKTALFFMKKIALEFRLPLCEMEPKNVEHLKVTLRKCELI